MERLLSTTMLLGMASLALFFTWGALVGGIAWMDKIRGERGQVAGMLAFAAVLGFMSAMMTLTMLYSHDPAEQRAPLVVAGILAGGVALAGFRRWAATHRNPVVRDAIDRWVHRAAAWGSLASLVVALGLMVRWLAATPAALTGFLAAVGLLLGWAKGSYFVHFGWNAPWFRPLTPIFVTRGPARSLAVALRTGCREFLALTPAARGALKDACLSPFIAAMAGVFLLFLPEGFLMRGHLPGGEALLAACFGLQGGCLFVLMLPVMLVMGFAFAFILMPLGLLRVAGGASGGAGASGEL